MSAEDADDPASALVAVWRMFRSNELPWEEGLEEADSSSEAPLQLAALVAAHAEAIIEHAAGQHAVALYDAVEPVFLTAGEAAGVAECRLGRAQALMKLGRDEDAEQEFS